VAVAGKETDEESSEKPIDRQAATATRTESESCDDTSVFRRDLYQRIVAAGIDNRQQREACQNQHKHQI
jgi:hypothetical protein